MKEFFVAVIIVAMVIYFALATYAPDVLAALLAAIF